MSSNVTDTEILNTDHPEALQRAASILRRGGLIVLPTDTVYGLACDAWNSGAVAKLYEIKGRSDQKSIPVLLSGMADIAEVARASDQARALAAMFWPGPLTLVVEKIVGLPEEISATSTVGVRAPDQPFARQLLEEYGPLAATSANLSGQPSSNTAGQVLQALGGRVDLLLDAGDVGGGVPSTVVDTTKDPPTLLREGPISMESILAAWESDEIAL